MTRRSLEVLGALDATFAELKVNRFVAERSGLRKWSVAIEQLVSEGGEYRLASVVGEGTTIGEAIGQALDRRAPSWAS